MPEEVVELLTGSKLQIVTVATPGSEFRLDHYVEFHVQMDLLDCEFDVCLSVHCSISVEKKTN